MACESEDVEWVVSAWHCKVLVLEREGWGGVGWGPDGDVNCHRMPEAVRACGDCAGRLLGSKWA